MKTAGVQISAGNAPLRGLPSKDTPIFSPTPISLRFGGVGRNLPFDGGCRENPVNTPFLGIKNYHLLTKFLLSIDGSFYGK
jgi:hypothetical protein